MKWGKWVLLLVAFAKKQCSSEKDSTGLPTQLHSLVQQLGTTEHEKDAKLWRRLGKIQLDAGEYAEARRIFCRGSECCPSDDGLLHHVRVWNAFHADVEEERMLREEQVANAGSTPEPLKMPLDSDVFLSLDVPVDAIPKSVRNWKGRVPPTARVRLIHASKDPVLPPEACQFLIDSALETVKSRGWTNDRHVQAPTCDIPVFDLPPAAQLWCRNAFHNVLFPLLASTVAPEIDVDPKDLRIQDCFVVRYDAYTTDGPGFSELRPHEDESLLSLTIALNDMKEYEGGGLFIASTGDLLNGDAGTVLCFAGGLVHGGYPMTKGTRWILTVFLYAESNESGKKPGYTLRAWEKFKEKKLQ